MITLKNAYAPVIMGKEATEKRARIEKATYYSIQNKCRDWAEGKYLTLIKSQKLN